MRKIVMLILGGVSLLLLSCGGEVSLIINVPSANAPGISLIWFSPSSALEGQGGGVVTSAVSVDFSDGDADVTMLTVSVSDSRGVTVSRTDTPLPGYSGVSSGTIFFSIDFSTTTADTYTFSAFVTDGQGNVSNPIFGTFTVIG